MPIGCGSTSYTPTGRQIDKHIARCVNLKITSKQKDPTTNPVWYSKPKRSPAEKMPEVCLLVGARDQDGPDWEAQLDETNRSKRGQSFAYADLLMGGIAYIRWMISKGVRITEGIANGMLGKNVKGRRNRSQLVPAYSW